MASERAKAIKQEREAREQAEQLEAVNERLTALEQENGQRFTSLEAKIDALLAALQPTDAKPAAGKK